MRACTKCGVEKPPEAFAFRSKAKGIRNGRCKDCVNAKQREYRAAHRDAVNAYQRAYWRNHPEKREAMLARKRARYWENPELARAVQNAKNRKRRESCTCTS